MKKVFRNTNLFGVISKQRALQLLGMEISVKHKIANIEIEISRYDMDDIFIDYADEDLKQQYYNFEEI